MQNQVSGSMFPPPAQMQPHQEGPQLPQPVHVPAHKKSADGQQQQSVVVQNLNLNSPKNNFQTQSQTVTPLPMLTNPSPFPQQSLGPNYHHALFPQPLFQTANHSFNMAPSPALPLQQQHVLQAPSAQDNFQQIRQYFEQCRGFYRTEFQKEIRQELTPVINKLENVIMNQQQLIVAMSTHLINGVIRPANQSQVPTDSTTAQQQSGAEKRVDRPKQQFYQSGNAEDNDDSKSEKIQITGHVKEMSQKPAHKRQGKGAKRGRKPLDLKTYIAQSQIRIREFKQKSKDQSRPIQERKKWRSCASALKTRLAIRVYREEKQNENGVVESIDEDLE